MPMNRLANGLRRTDDRHSKNAASGDGFDRTVVLDCGDTFRAREAFGLPSWKIGDWTSCAEHSTIVGYDPDYGTPKYNRDRRVIEVRRDA